MNVFVFVCTVFSFVTLCTADYNTTLHNFETSKYVTEYLGKCTNNEQCEWLGENGGCYHYHCLCKDGYRWYQGVCRQTFGLGQSCTDSLDCYDGYNPLSLTCTDGKCVCADGYYNRDNIDCRKIAKKEGDLCSLNIDCKFKNAICNLGKCKTSTTTTIEYNEPINIESIQPFEEIFAQKTQSCKTAEDCKNITNSECYSKTGTCVCKRGYFFNSDGSTCIGEIGMNVHCKTDKDCPIKPGKCVSGTCYCRDYYLTAIGNRECVKTISETNWNCLSIEWCYALGPYSYCSSKEQCNCSSIADYNKDDEICEKTRNDSSICTTDLSCQDTLRNGVCSDEKCICSDVYEKNDNMCSPVIGGECDDNTPCIANAYCKDTGVCACNANYITAPITGNRKCYKVASRVGDTCEVNEQCSTMDVYSTCSKNQCTCMATHFQANGRCYRRTEYKSYCTNRIECTGSLDDTFYCRNNICQCKTGDKYESGTCKSAAVINFVNSILIFVVVLNLFGSIFN